MGDMKEGEGDLMKGILLFESAEVRRGLTRKNNNLCQQKTLVFFLNLIN